MMQDENKPGANMPVKLLAWTLLVIFALIVTAAILITKYFQT
jgi:hypothetical protein